MDKINLKKKVIEQTTVRIEDLKIKEYVIELLGGLGINEKIIDETAKKILGVQGIFQENIVNILIKAFDENEKMKNLYVFPDDTELENIKEEILNTKKEERHELIRDNLFPIAEYGADGFIVNGNWSKGMESLLGYSIELLEEKKKEGITPLELMYSYSEGAQTYAQMYGDVLRDGHSYERCFSPKSHNGEILKTIFHSQGIEGGKSIRIVVGLAEV